MSHPQQMNFVSNLKRKFPSNFKDVSVLEVGSLNINGTIRIFFENCDYLGVDVGAGNGVDLVCPGQDLTLPDNSYDTVASCECFEHNPFWKETFENMIRLAKPGGLIFFSCATTGRPEHGTEKTTPNDSPLTIAKGWHYYKNLTRQDFEHYFNFAEAFSSYEFNENKESSDLYFYGIRR